MAQILTKKGLDIPIAGGPKGPVQPLSANGHEMRHLEIALNFAPFPEVKPKLLKKVGETVKIGEAVIQDKEHPERLFVSPAAGVIKEVRRGLKRRLLDLVIEVAEKEESEVHKTVDPRTANREEILAALCKGGAFAHIRQRPFDTLANPKSNPSAIFIKGIESAPFLPSQEMQIEGREEDFQTGLEALRKLSGGKVHLIYRQGSNSKAFADATGVEKTTAQGPHPIGNSSVHIHHLQPIQHYKEVVWTLTAYDTVVIGHLLKTGKYLTETIISIAGPGILPQKTGYFRIRRGAPAKDLIAGRIEKGPMRFVSGSLLTGTQVEQDDFLGFYDFGFAVLPENTNREKLHFFRPGVDKYTASRTYLTGWLDNSKRKYDFSTNQHGEERGFILGAPYDKVMPMNIPTMNLVRAILAEDYELAEQLGLLEVSPEDFALATFVCPSKIDMVDIVRSGLAAHSEEVLG